MDPDEALRSLRKAVEWELGRREVSGPVEVAENAGLMAESIDGLDQWLSKGGFLPAAWRR